MFVFKYKFVNAVVLVPFSRLWLERQRFYKYLERQNFKLSLTPYIFSTCSVFKFFNILSFWRTLFQMEVLWFQPFSISCLFHHFSCFELPNSTCHGLLQIFSPSSAFPSKFFSCFVSSENQFEFRGCYGVCAESMIPCILKIK